ncbi:MAG: BamA/TamA family outer membrane protein [Deltaproteobacteria bacterium]|nr:BamA/TamA family outer membrane protein [Deltaproteobacteria bacterium]
MRSAPLALLIASLFGPPLGGCSEFVKPVLPGETAYAVESVEWRGATLDRTLLDPTLSVRASSLIIPGQPYNPYRLAEDRRRIGAYWRNYGYFDVVVDKADVAFDEQSKTVRITWTVHEGPRYALRSVRLSGAPDELAPRMNGRIGFAAGAPLDLQAQRVRRHELADVLRDDGFLRAEVYSRTFVDRQAKAVDWVFFADPGERAIIGKLEVVGAKKIPEDVILDRIDLAPGQPITLERLRKLELDLADTNGFTVARIEAKAGTEFETGAVPYETWIPPDTGGIIAASQVDAEGNLVPRVLAREVDVSVQVREAPAAQLELGAGANIDLERVDPYARLRLWLRNALGPLHHLSFDGHVGYGLRWRGDIDEPLGLHGSARFMWSRPGLIGRLGDVRLVASFDEELYPGFHWRTAAAGLGFRTLFDKGLFLDIEPRFRWDDDVGIGTIDDATREALDLGPADATMTGEARLSLVWDGRDDGVEPMKGHLLALRGSVAPFGEGGDATWLGGQIDLRWILGFSPDLALGFRASGSWVASLGDDGVPIGARLFGGGAWGMRGFPTRQMSLYTTACGGAVNGGEDNATDCRSLAVGAASMFEGSIDFRWLPYRKQFGATLFADFGGVGAEANPFDGGIDVAAGLGLRIRIWHIPVGLDMAYRLTGRAMFGPAQVDRFVAFLRVGEAF